MNESKSWSEYMLGEEVSVDFTFTLKWRQENSIRKRVTLLLEERDFSWEKRKQQEISSFQD
jgi:hypothetical protein